MSENRIMPTAEYATLTQSRSLTRAGTFVGAIGLTAAVLTLSVIFARLTTAENPPTSILLLVTMVLIYGFRPMRRWFGQMLGRFLHDDTAQDDTIDRLADAVATFTHPEVAIEEMAVTIADALDARSVRVGLNVHEGVEVVAEVKYPGARCGVVAWNDPITTAIGTAEDPLGEITVDLGRSARARDLALVEELASAVAIVAQTAVLRRTIRHRISLAEQQRSELLAARSHLARVQLEERRRLERDLHDTCQQRAVVLAGRTGLLAAGSIHDPEEITAVLRDAGADISRISESIDAALGVARIRALDDGVAKALLADVADLTVPVEVIDETTRRFRRSVEENVYACCSEAITNGVKHASAGRIVVRLKDHDDVLEFVVNDDGEGFATDAISRSGGLANLERRVRAGGGTLHVRSGPNGTRVAGSVST